MRITPEQFGKAFEEFQKFGPHRRIPVQERWREILPEISSSQSTELLALCEGIEAFALILAEQVRDEKLSDENARKRLAQKYPFLNHRQSDHAWSQALYFSFK